MLLLAGMLLGMRGIGPVGTKGFDCRIVSVELDQLYHCLKGLSTNIVLNNLERAVTVLALEHAAIIKAVIRTAKIISPCSATVARGTLVVKVKMYALPLVIPFVILCKKVNIEPLRCHGAYSGVTTLV